MRHDFKEFLQRELLNIDEAGLLRHLREIHSAQGARVEINNCEMVNFSSNDYLGFANHPVLKVSVAKTVEEFGAGTGAARLISGSLRPHQMLENVLADFKGTEAALSFSTGYAAAGVIPVLVGKGDVIVVDKLSHACLVDAARLSEAKLRVFKHNDLDDLERILHWAGLQDGRTLVVTESVFSMEGDIAPLLNLVELKERYGAWLMVDEAHATGLYGENRRGLVEEFDVGERIEVQMGTLGKALGAAGGYVCGSRALIDLLLNRVRTFMFSTAPVPAQVAAAQAGIELVQSSEGGERRTILWSLVDRLKNGLVHQKWKIPPIRSAIISLIVGSEDDALALSERLMDGGILVPAIRYPTVARGAARLRITVSASHSPEDIDALLEVIGDA